VLILQPRKLIAASRLPGVDTWDFGQAQMKQAGDRRHPSRLSCRSVAAIDKSSDARAGERAVA